MSSYRIFSCFGDGSFMNEDGCGFTGTVLVDPRTAAVYLSADAAEEEVESAGERWVIRQEAEFVRVERVTNDVPGCPPAWHCEVCRPPAGLLQGAIKYDPKPRYRSLDD